MFSKNRIILINCAPGDYPSSSPNVNPPLGVLSIGTVLAANGYEVNIVDLQVEKDYIDKINKLLKLDDILFIGFSVTTPQVGTGIELSSLVKKIRPDIPLVWGGIHTTLFPEQTVSDPLVDIGVIGEGEYVSLELAERLKKGEELDSVKGIVFKIKDEIRVNPKDTVIFSLDELPFLNYELIDVEKYVNKDFRTIGGKQCRSLNVISARGCPYQCTFCINSIYLKGRFRQRSVQSAMQEVELLLKKYNLEHILFIDEDFFAVKSRTMNFLETMEKLSYRFKWYASFRANHIGENYLNKEIIERLKKIGLYHWGSGVESGSYRVRSEILKKNIRTEQFIWQAKLAKEYGINTGWSFMMGIPGETKKELKETFRLALKLFEIYPENSYIIGPQILRPYPGSLIYQECLKYSFKQPRTLQEWVGGFDATSGHLSIKNMDWIKEPEFIYKLCFAGMFGFRRWGKTNNKMKKLIVSLIELIQKFRIRGGFYSLHFEYYIYSFYQKIKKIDKTKLLRDSE